MKLKNKIRQFIKWLIVGGICLITSVPLMAKTTREMYVEKASVCTEIHQLEPVGSDTSFVSDVKYLYCWSKIINGAETAIQHIWYYKNQKIAAIPLDIRYNSVRTYSRKSIPADWLGDWKDLDKKLQDLMAKLNDTEEKISLSEEIDPQSEWFLEKNEIKNITIKFIE